MGTIEHRALVVGIFGVEWNCWDNDRDGTR